MIKKILILTLLISYVNIVNAQNITQTVQGKIVEKETQIPMPGVTVVVLNTNPLLAASSDTSGKFIIKNVPVGRYTIQFTFIGYEPVVMKDVLISSGKETVLFPEMKESFKYMKEMVITANKGEALNSMASLNVRQLSVEEARRYAGGFDDPARLASSFAGVSSNLGNNGIVIRGVAPKGLLWKMEGIEIPNPTHFANLQAVGAGAITALSSMMLTNSDFYTGAFPADYGNALSGVFDVKLRTGNYSKYEHAFQLGLAGIDFASEGPFVQGKQSSYAINYRYSTFTLLAPLLPEEMGKLSYQDACFKFNFVMPKNATLSIWGIGAYDKQSRSTIADSLEWTSDIDKEAYKNKMYMGAVGVNYKVISGKKTFFNYALAITGSGLLLKQSNLNENLSEIPIREIENVFSKYTFSGYVNHKFNAAFSNRTGVIVNIHEYSMNIQDEFDGSGLLSTLVKQNGKSEHVQAYSQCKYDLTEKLNLVFGMHFQYFELNKKSSIEPRISAKYILNPLHSIGLSFGMHSQLEMLNFYLVQLNTTQGTVFPNKNLDFSKANHLVFTYEYRLNEYLKFKAEPYMQQLYNVPVVPGSYYSMLNMEQGFYFNDSLVNKGKGMNLGIDFTLEKYFNKGLYYMLTLSLFDSKYSGGDGVVRNSRFNRRYVVNILGGKEWSVGKSRNDKLNVNGKLCIMGGEWMNPVDYTASYQNQDIVEDISNAYTQRKKNAAVLSVSLNYIRNKTKHASIWSFNMINILGYKELQRYYFDKMSNSIKKEEDQIVMPGISYKIEF